MRGPDHVVIWALLFSGCADEDPGFTWSFDVYVRDPSLSVTIDGQGLVDQRVTFAHVELQYDSYEKSKMEPLVVRLRDATSSVEEPYAPDFCDKVLRRSFDGAAGQRERLL